MRDWSLTSEEIVVLIEENKAIVRLCLIADGQIVEEWNTLEQLAVFEQLGVMPTPE